jgi:hypothetical protein
MEICKFYRDKTKVRPVGDGRPAIRAMARKIVEIEEMTTEDCTFSVGIVSGGQWVNFWLRRPEGDAAAGMTIRPHPHIPSFTACRPS